MRDNRAVPDFLSLDLSHDFTRNLLLFGGMIEDRRSVLRADVVSLAVERGGVVDREKYFEQFAEGRNGGIEGDLNHFGVTRRAATDLLVGRVGLGTAHVARHDLQDTLHFKVDRLETPEAAPCECRYLHLAHGLPDAHVVAEGPKEYVILSETAPNTGEVAEWSKAAVC